MIACPLILFSSKWQIGTGFDIRNTNHVDIEEDVDVDGADEAIYGEAQFTERDIIVGEDMDVDIGDVEDLRNLVAGPTRSAGKSIREAAIDDEVVRAADAGDMPAMQAALGKRSLDLVNA